MGFTDILLPDDIRNEKLLKADPLYDRLDKKQQEEAVAAAVQTGESYAAWLRQHFKEGCISEVLLALDINVKQEHVPNARLSPYSIYRIKTKTITLHVNIIEDLVEDLIKITNEISYDELSENVMNVILFHELFHHLEESKFKKASKQYQVKVINLGFFSISSGIKALSEIGAHTFTKACIGDIERYLNITTKEVCEYEF
ncbi:hypothetical protein SAMN04488072_101434 [Lentibacillus halodurans]|uniref:Uncharacterized protein n=1 Tax=Lentibacillus halodurans TaxID=237679 RepID=A0A1I0VI31_9BACI|nr:hypothetical protein [Lentibacillus halodurans]SFA75972.1 hypothetical protein SAMN04488072_101434 [Lentibacillus halodurans]